MTYEEIRILHQAVDPAFYRSRYPDIAEAGVDPIEHYATQGWREGRDPNAWFSTNSYLDQHPELREAGVNPLLSFLAAVASAPAAPDRASRWECDLIRPFFDADFYTGRLLNLTGVDLSAEGIDPVEHYLDWGLKLAVNPTSWFSSVDYLALHTDVAAAGVEPFVHYISVGREEQRAISSEIEQASPVEADNQDAYVCSVVSAEFDAAFYCGENPDVEAAGVDPLQHYLDAGWREGRDPSPTFSTTSYLELNPDVATAGINPFFHFIVAGRNEGRVGRAETGYRYDILKNVEPIQERVARVRRDSPPRAPSPLSALRASLEDLSRSNGKQLYVSVSHDDFTANFGGVQLCLMREAQAIEEAGFDHVHLYPATALPVVDLESRDPLVGVLVNGRRVGFFRTSSVATNLQLTPYALTGKRGFAIHSLLGHSGPAIRELLRGIGCKSGAFWLHDYASLCDNYNLMRNDVQFCGAPAIDSGACKICAYSALRAAQIQAHASLFSAFDMTVLAPSQTALNIWTASTKLPFKRSMVIPHSHLEDRNQFQSKPSLSTGPLRVAFIGLPVPHKGWRAFRELVLKYGRDPRYEFWHFGNHSPKGLPLRFMETTVTATAMDAMTRALDQAGIDVAMIWSLWPETYCFAAFEALASGASILTHVDSGNVASLVEHGAPGRVVENEQALEALFESGEILDMDVRRRAQRARQIFSNMTGAILSEIAQ
ncbi:MAG: hypothetical protein JF617_02390 [Burkholderiales bacterium]|nr:hypothetical protein [Burkholderiales bacterium]